MAQLELTWSSVDTFLAEVWVLHVGRREWELKPAVPIVLVDEGDGAGGKGEKPRPWSWNRQYMGDKVVPVGDRFLCWVDNSQGYVFLCDMAEERPVGISPELLTLESSRRIAPLAALQGSAWPRRLGWQLLVTSMPGLARSFVTI